MRSPGTDTPTAGLPSLRAVAVHVVDGKVVSGAALYGDPWQGQSNCLPADATVQPRWVQMALNAAAVPAVGRATTIGAPAAFLVTTPVPTGMSASAARTAPPPADAVPDPADPAPEADPLDAPAPAP